VDGALVGPDVEEPGDDRDVALVRLPSEHARPRRPTAIVLGDGGEGGAAAELRGEHRIEPVQGGVRGHPLDEIRVRVVAERPREHVQKPVLEVVSLMERIARHLGDETGHDGPLLSEAAVPREQVQQGGVGKVGKGRAEEELVLLRERLLLHDPLDRDLVEIGVVALDERENGIVVHGYLTRGIKRRAGRLERMAQRHRSGTLGCRLRSWTRSGSELRTPPRVTSTRRTPAHSVR
jgi:hypothetical protein